MPKKQKGAELQTQTLPHTETPQPALDGIRRLIALYRTTADKLEAVLNRPRGADDDTDPRQRLLTEARRGPSDADVTEVSEMSTARDGRKYYKRNARLTNPLATKPK